MVVFSELERYVWDQFGCNQIAEGAAAIGVPAACVVLPPGAGILDGEAVHLLRTYRPEKRVITENGRGDRPV